MFAPQCPSIVAGLFVLIVPTLQLTGRMLRVRDSYSLSLLFSGYSICFTTPGTLLVLNSKTNDVRASLVSGLFLFLSRSPILTPSFLLQIYLVHVAPLGRCPAAHSGPEVHSPLVSESTSVRVFTR